MRGLSPKDVVVDEILSEDCFSPFVSDSELMWSCESWRVFTSLQPCIYLHVCHISAKIKQEIFTSLLATANISITERLIKGVKNVKKGEKRRSPSTRFMLPNCCQKLT